MKENIIMADCVVHEHDEFKSGLEEVIGEKFVYYSCVCNKHGGLNDIRRLLTYITYPLKFVFRRSQYKYIIGWQQFFALFYCFWSRIFHLKKCNTVVAVNFTYKRKNGVIGFLYKAVMRYCMCSKYLDYLHVPSQNYADSCSKEFGLKREKFIVAHFGIEDVYKSYTNSPVEYKDYTFSIGRSNRDFDWLANFWRQKQNSLLIIASDVWEPKHELPENVIHRRDIKGEAQYKYIANAKQVIIPIDDGEICSGDTVLLTAMAFSKLVYISTPSTLSEMYIEDGVDGIFFKKTSNELLTKMMSLESNPLKVEQIEKRARNKFLSRFTRYQLGVNVGRYIL